MKNPINSKKEKGIYELYIFIYSALFYIATFSANLQWDRLLTQININLSFEPNAFSQIRTFFFVACIVLLIILERICKPTLKKTSINTPILISTTLIFLLNLVYIFLFREESTSTYSAILSWNFIFNSLTIGLLVISYHYFGRKFINSFLTIAVVVVLLGAVYTALLGSNAGERPLASTYTFYRVAIFGGFSALYLTWIYRKEKPRLAFLLIVAAILCFAASYMTLSKAALLAGTASLALLSFLYLLKRRYSFLFISISVTLVSIFLFWGISGNSFTQRVETGMLKPVTPLAEQIDNQLALAEANRSASNQLEKLAQPESARTEIKNWQLDFVDYFLCKSEGGSCDTPQYSGAKIITDELLKHHVYLPDYSFRIRLLLEGLDGFIKNPLVGNGFGDYLAITVNRYSHAEEIYHYPHNLLIELLYSTGLTGTLLFSMVLLLALYYYANGHSLESLPIFALFISIFIGSLFGGDYSDFRLGWLTLILMLLLSDRQKLDSY